MVSPGLASMSGRCCATRPATALTWRGAQWHQGKWRLSATSNADWQRTDTDSDRSGIQTDKARSTRTALAADATANGPLFKLPAGNATATFKLAANTVSLDTKRTRLGASTSTRLNRDRADGSVNLDLPILKNSPVGRLTANANAELEQLSDFGSLTTYGAGLNWAPRDRLNFIASWTREEGAPSIEQLGDPVIETQNARIFDFTTGQTVNVTAVTGGNPGLDADRRSVFKLGANFSRSTRLISASAPTMSDRPSIARFPASPGRALHSRRPSPIASSAMAAAISSTSTSVRSISTSRAARRCGGALTQQAAEIGSPLRFAAGAIALALCASWRRARPSRARH